MSEENLVGIIMGSDSDLPVMEEAFRVLEDFQIPYEARILSAHRSPGETGEYARSAEGRGIRVLIAGAGWAAHLAGVLAAETVLPVIGVPIDSSPLQGLDSLLSTVQMPPGIPVATMAIGKGGAKNAALLAVQILATENDELRERLRGFKRQMAEEVNVKKREKLERYLSTRGMR
ncbi:MAG: 5-(carboxyamino)imidazole ribonucleotide mutase [Deltaproteobacteria bacterium]|nr:5-(carboxyamino)imidazole ribonucleotide mutase [Deltaproteobacteria bacterium]